MIEKPSGGTSPYSHLTSQSTSLRLTPKSTPKNDMPTSSASSRLSASERLNSTRGSSNSLSNTPNLNQSNGHTTPLRSQTPISRRPVSQASSGNSYSSASLPRPARRTTTPRSGAYSVGSNLTSTPTSSRPVEVALVNPMQPTTPSSLTPTRRDVPPDIVPSPIRRDVVPDTNSLRRNRPSHDNDSRGTPSRRPPTPTKPKPEENSNESEKSTLWFEYGCV